MIDDYFSNTGRIIAKPQKEWKEQHEKNVINIAVYNVENRFYYSFFCKLGYFICSFSPHKDSEYFVSEYAARESACLALLQKISKDKQAKKTARQFTVTEYRQLEFEF